MSTHNIGFYEDLTKVIFELSSNIIKYPPYFFCWVLTKRVMKMKQEECHLGHKHRFVVLL